METTIKSSIFRVTGKAPEGVDNELIEQVVQGADLYTDVLVNLICFVAGSRLEDRDSRFAARDITVSLINDFRKLLSAEPREVIALTIIVSYFSNPRLVTASILKIMIKNWEKAI